MNKSILQRNPWLTIYPPTVLRSVGRSGGRSILRSVGRSGGRSFGRSGGRSFGRSGGRSFGRSGGLTVGPSVGPSVGRFGRFYAGRGSIPGRATKILFLRPGDYADFGAVL